MPAFNRAESERQMGAEFNSMRINGSLPEAEVIRIFAEAQERDRYENGHSYSGGIGMANGLCFVDRPMFMSVREAKEWLVDNAEKWGPAIAVKATESDCAVWVIGALCSS